MLNAVEGGRSGEPVLLLVHPMGADLTFWDACRAELEPGWRCVAVDLRGAGGSPAAHKPLSISDHADDLAGFCEERNLGPVVIVGCAVGAMIAAVFAGRNAGLCRGVVLSNPGFRTLPAARDALARRAADARAGGMEAIRAAATEAAFFGCPRDGRRQAYVDRFVLQDAEQYTLQIEGMLDADTSPYLSAVAAPVLIVAGGLDLLLPAEHALNVGERLARSTYALMPTGAHFIPYQRPVEFAALVDGFARRLESA